MERNEFILNFADQFEETDKDILTEDTEFKNLDEWCSFLALTIIAMVDDEYNVKLTGNDINSAKTISDLFEIVKNKA